MNEHLLKLYDDLLFRKNGAKSENEALLKKLLEWMQSFLDNDREKIFYFTLPIWDYVRNTWKKPTFLSVSKQNDPIFKDDKDGNGWYSYTDESDKIKKGLTYSTFFENAKKTGFTFVGFITQDIKLVLPIFEIEFGDQNEFNESSCNDKYTLKIKVDDKKGFEDIVIPELKKIIKKKSDDNDDKQIEKFFNFLKIYHESFKDLKYIYLISSRLFSKTDSDLSSGGLILVCKEKVDEKKLKLLSVAVNLCYREVGGKDWEKNNRIESIKSAVAAIITRNLSHDLGSHFLTNTKNYFRNTVDKINPDLLNIIAADYRGNVRVLQYVQERMDFVATIVSTDLYPLVGLNFKAEFFDILTNDDCGARHSNDKQDKNEKNFLLQYLLYSEHLTRKYNFDKENFSDFPVVELKVKYGDRDYTGKSDKKNSEQSLKNELSKLRLAVPGGVMGRHALFTLVENILRNAAKHSKHTEDLVLTIKIVEEDNKCILYFYDNCKSAKSAKEVIQEKFKEIMIIGDDAKLNKYDKGLKEMLFCAIWLKNEDLSQTLFDIQNKKAKAERYIRVIKVDDEGNEIEDEKKDGNLCYTIELDKWKTKENLSDKKKGDIISLSKEEFLKIHADFITADNDCYLSITDGRLDVKKKLSEIFPRFMIDSEIDDKKKDLLEKYNIVIEFPDQSLYNQEIPNVFDRNGKDESWKKSKNNILFFDHLMDAKKQDDWNSDELKNAVYTDSISGENFTSTLIQPDLLKDDDFRYKVIESAITRIAIVDERIWGFYHALHQTAIKKTADWLDFKTIFEGNYDYSNLIRKIYFRLLSKNISWNQLSFPDNFDDFSEKEKKDHLKTEVFQNLTTARESKQIALLKKRNIFVYTVNDNGKIVDIENNEVEEVACDFVSIHLGLLDKDKGQDSLFRKDNGSLILNDKFKEKPFVSIHSGRGNFSPNLEKELRDYPFITLSTLESALNNSKFLLSEFFNNINYYGKGNLNNK